MALNEKSKEELSKYFEQKLREQYRNGIAVGVKTACRVVLDTLEDRKVPFATRVEEVKKFCKKPFNMAIATEDREADET